jgi:hypothetical protein
MYMLIACRWRQYVLSNTGKNLPDFNNVICQNSSLRKHQTSFNFMSIGVTDFGQPANGTTYWPRAGDSWSDKAATPFVSSNTFYYILLYMFVLFYGIVSLKQSFNQSYLVQICSFYPQF